MEYSPIGNDTRHADLKKILMLFFVIVAIVLIVTGIYWYFSRSIVPNEQESVPLTKSEKLEQLNYLASLQTKSMSEEEQKEELERFSAKSNTPSSISREEKISDLELLIKK